MKFDQHNNEEYKSNSNNKVEEKYFQIHIKTAERVAIGKLFSTTLAQLAGMIQLKSLCIFEFLRRR